MPLQFPFHEVRLAVSGCPMLERHVCIAWQYIINAYLVLASIGMAGLAASSWVTGFHQQYTTVACTGGVCLRACAFQCATVTTVLAHRNLAVTAGAERNSLATAASDRGAMHCRMSSSTASNERLMLQQVP
jgi:hypothetical protein